MEEEKEKHKQDCLPSSVKKADDSVDVTQMMPQGQQIPSPHQPLLADGEQPPPLPPKKTKCANSTVDRTVIQQPRQCSSNTSMQNQPQQQSVSRMDAEWYWGNISRENVAEMLNGIPNGSFLVIDSAEVEGEYILMLRNKGVNNPLKILHSDGMYGFSDMLTFNSVAELVDFHCNFSLVTCNPSLDISLLYPIFRSKEGAFDFNRARDDLKDLERQLQHFNKIEEQITQKIHNIKNEIDAKNEILKIMEEHVKIRQSTASANDNEVEDYTCVTQEFQQQLRVKSPPPVLDQTLPLSPKDPLPPVLSEELPNYPSASVNVFSHKKYWFLEINREDSFEKLRNAKDGTFLVRPTKNTKEPHHVYTVDIKYTDIKHLKVFQMNGKYGFANPCEFDSLKDMIVHYSKHELVEFNPMLTTTLKFPINDSSQY